MDSALRPRDIQARIRAGESPERVASAAGTTVDKIMGFAGPVLAERAWVAQQAQRASVRRRTGAGPVGHLADAVEAHLERQALDADAVAWDAWRRDDGRWTVVAAVPGDEPATFVYDTAGRYVLAEDDASRRLVGERTGAQPRSAAGDETPAATDATAQPEDRGQPGTGPERAAPSVVPGRDRPASARPDNDEPGGWAALGAMPPAVTERAGARRPRIGEQVELGEDALDVVTGSGTRRPAGPQGDAAPPPASDETGSETLFDVGPGAEPEAASDAASDVGGADPAEDTGSGGDADRTRPRGDRPRRGRSRRASVPSWDEIMFGSPKAD